MADAEAPKAEADSTAAPADDAVVAKLRELLKDANLEEVTGKQLRQQLEAHFGVKLKDRSELIKGEIDAFLMAGEEDEEEQEEQEEQKGKKRKGGFGTVMLSEPLAAFMGCEQAARSEVTKRIWEHIHAHGLQQPKDKRKIIVDEVLGKFLKHPVNMLSMNAQLSKHMHKVEDVKGHSPKAPAAKRPKPSSTSSTRGVGVSGGGGTGKAKAKHGMYAPCPLSPALAALVGQPEMERGSVTKWFWEYVSTNDLKEPSNKSLINSNTALRELGFPAQFKGFGCQKYLAAHIYKPGSA